MITTAFFIVTFLIWGAVWFCIGWSVGYVARTDEDYRK
jgi:hypothetical protein